MRVNIYAEELTDRIEIVEKTTEEGSFTGLRFYLELPVTIKDCDCIDPSSECPTQNISGPFIHRYGDDDSAAVTFWGKNKMRQLLQKALEKLDNYYDAQNERNATR